MRSEPVVQPPQLQFSGQIRPIWAPQAAQFAQRAGHLRHRGTGVAAGDIAEMCQIPFALTASADHDLEIATAV